MAKSKLLHIVALSAAFALVGCSSSAVQDDSDGTISTDPVAEVEAPTEVSEELTEAADAVDNSMAGMPEINVVYFDFDQSKIKPEFRMLLKAHAEYLTANAGVRVILEGHADERGTREYNLALGERRADAVGDFLKVLGVSTDQYELVSFGEEKPVDMGKSSDAYAKNRRVEFKYQ